MTWADVWNAIKNYRPDWFDIMCGVISVGLAVGYAWYVGSWTKGLIEGFAMVVLGWIAIEVIGPLWFPRWWRKK